MNTAMTLFVATGSKAARKSAMTATSRAAMDAASGAKLAVDGFAQLPADPAT